MPAKNVITFTLDTNCLIDLDEQRPAAAHVKALIEAANAGEADLALVASSASERQRSGDFLQNVAAFSQRCEELGVGGLPRLPSIGRWNVSFFGEALYSWDEGEAKEQTIYQTLFPNSPFSWADYAASRQSAVEDTGSGAYRRWRNQILDAQALWAHDHAARDVFVTSDGQLARLNGHADFPAMRVLSPADAAAEL